MGSKLSFIESMHELHVMADAISLTLPNLGLSATLLSKLVVNPTVPKARQNICKYNNTISMYGGYFYDRHTAQRHKL